MYKAKLWDEDKWNIHSSSYNSSKDATFSDEKKYNEQKYGLKEKNVSSDYMRRDEQKEKEDKDRDAIFGSMEEKDEKQEIKEDELQFKAAKQIFNENVPGSKKIKEKREINTIEDAIKKAIEEEKKVIIMDS